MTCHNAHEPMAQRTTIKFGRSRSTSTLIPRTRSFGWGHRDIVTSFLADFPRVNTSNSWGIFPWTSPFQWFHSSNLQESPLEAMKRQVNFRNALAQIMNTAQALCICVVWDHQRSPALRSSILWSCPPPPSFQLDWVPRLGSRFRRNAMRSCGPALATARASTAH